MAIQRLLNQARGYFDRATALQATSATTHNVLVEGVIKANDLLLVIGTFDGQPTVTPPSGFTGLYSTLSGTSVLGYAGWRAAAGSEGGKNLTFETSASEDSALILYRFSGMGSVAEGAAAFASSGNVAQPPSLTPSWGAAEVFWLAALHTSTSQTPIATPTNYSGLISAVTGDTTADAQAYALHRVVTAASETPDQFTMSSSGANRVMGTIGVRLA